jgi:hypothetical protein
MEALALLFIIGIIILFYAAESYQKASQWPIARSMVKATWPMRPGKEGFANMTLKQWLPAPEVVAVPSVGEYPVSLMNAAEYEVGLKLKNYDLLSDTLEPNLNIRGATGPTSKKCYDVNYSKSLELSSHAQRTNNYIHKNGESCSAHNHDLILNLYKN